ncbi:MAG: hypothetical protein OWT28_00385 [Firmicutes bacterium]|nr:hypothetical protein [Bacillota bacterium]
MDNSMFQSTNKTEGGSAQEESRQSVPQVIIVHDGRDGQSRHTGRWWLLAIAVVCVVAVAIWMSSIGATVSHVQSTVTQNSNMLAAQQAHLSAMTQMLTGISQSLSRLSSEMSNFFATVISLLSKHLQ